MELTVPMITTEMQRSDRIRGARTTLVLQERVHLGYVKRLLELFRRR